jgi:RimJ/RimL family protein N-acetyltransferase
MSEGAEKLNKIPVEVISIDTSHANSTLDLLVERVVEWKKNGLVAQGLSPTSFTDREHSLRYLTAPNSFLIGVVVENELSGYVRISHINHGTKTGLIDYVIGDTNLWGKNVATSAVTKALDTFRLSDKLNEGMTIFATTKSWNVGSIKTAEKVGFTECTRSETLPEGIFVKDGDRLLKKEI